MVCEMDFEFRHPQELIRPITDQQRLPWTRPEATDSFFNTQCTLTGRQGVSGLGVAGCAIVKFDVGAKGLTDTTHNA